MNKELANNILLGLEKMHPNAKCELDFTTPYELLVATILSAQCTDKRVNEVTKVLFKTYNTPEKILELGEDGLKPFIFSCGFYNNKAKNILAMTKELIEKYGGEVPKNLELLTQLPGVGRKTASVVMSVAYNEPAMPVDTHVFRVSNRLGLSNGKTPEEVETDLRGIYKKEDWYKVHHTLIFHGRYICQSRNPKCGECCIKECPSRKE